MSERPEFCTDEMLTFLDDLRESGIVNMFGASSYLADEFEELPDMKNAKAVLIYWMDSFTE